MLEPTAIPRVGEEINSPKLSEFLQLNLGKELVVKEIRQFTGGYSNLTYLVITNQGQWVLRRPPGGVAIQHAHDMGREYRVLEKLKGIYGRIPNPVILCEDESVLGYPFYLMEKINGLILRHPQQLDMEFGASVMRQISESVVDNLALLHQINIHSTGLGKLGKPEGYVGRQVAGWTKRYQHAMTDDIPDMHNLARWMEANQPKDDYPGLIHNDYKYDNLVLDASEPARILAVLDWEMATVGDTRMDLGTSLAYWSEPSEADASPLMSNSVSWLPGNLNREEVVERYAKATGHDPGNILFYYVYGTFKIAVIVQQIYSRWKKGLSQDPRFGELIHGVRFFAHLGKRAIEKGRISDLL
ncbi:MAG: phosphotransferase family protein [Saprospiraceae bacterium]